LYLKTLFSGNAADIYISTGPILKFKYLRNILAAHAVPAEIGRAQQLVDNLQDAPEDTGSFEGNLKQKLDEFTYAWDLMGTADQTLRLAQLKRDPRKTIIMVEDSGFHFLEPNLLYEPEIYNRLNDKLRARFKPDMDFPGPEAAPVINACGGPAAFFNLIETIEQRRGRPIDRRIVASSYIGIMPLLHQKRRLIVPGTIMNTFVTRPQPADGTIQLENFLVPKSADPANELTEAELERSGVKFSEQFSPKAVAWENMSAVLGIPNEAAVSVPRRKATRDFVTGIVTDDSNAPSITPEEQGAAKLLSTNIDRLEDVETKIFDQADGFIFCFDPSREAIEKNFFRNTFIITSAVVGHQTHDRHVMAKPLILINPNGAFDYLEKMIWDLHRINAVPENPNDLYRSFKTIAEAKAFLKGCEPDYYYMPPSQEKTYAVGERHSKKGTAIFCSATSENESVCRKAKAIVEFMKGIGDNLVSGLGMNGTMGALTHAAADLGVHHTGFSVGHIMNRPQGEGHGEEFASYFGLCKHIYERIESFFKHSNILLMFFGGLGTIQEMAAFCWLKERLLENPNDQYAQMVAGSEGIIWDEKYMHRGEKISCFGNFIAAAPSGSFQKLGVHIARSQEETENKMLEIRTRQKPPAIRQWLTAPPPTMGIQRSGPTVL
jgi:predicted Rossmann-fold nucleotide-binding protein